MKRAAVLATCAIVGLGGLGLGLAGLAPVPMAEEPALRLRGAGKTREALSAMQLKPFNNALWSHLSDWNGAAPKAEDMTGKVVMIVTWSSWYPVTHGAMKTAQALHDKYHKLGLVVVGVHNSIKPEGAADNAKAMGITFPWALDKEGKFRAGLRADQDPNIYFIDRSGNLRYAQVDKSSMEDAATHLVGETADAAKDYPLVLERKRIETEKHRWLTKDPTGLRPGEEPQVTFAEPDEDAYAKVRWPYLVGKVEKDPILDKIKNESPKIINMPEEDWIPSKPNRAGRLTVLYFLDPKDVQQLGAIPVMNKLHDSYKRDVIVACSAFKTGTNLDDSNANTEEEEKLKQRNKELFASVLRTREVNHFLNPTVLRAEKLEFSPESLLVRVQTSREEQGIAVILSTDDRIRWIGGTYEPELRLALDKLIAVDPAVQARRKAQDAKAKGR